MSLFDSLGFDEVEADPNALPDSKWVGVIYKSEMVYSQKKDSLSHVITYKVTEGERAGAERQEWWTFGTDPIKDEHGNLVDVKNQTMSGDRKSWYKTRLLNLGVPESGIKKVMTDPKILVGTEIIFGTKKNGEFININFVERRNSAPQDTGSVDPFESGYLNGAPTPTPGDTGATNTNPAPLSDLI